MSAPPKHFFDDRKLNIIVCQLRNNNSQLNANIFNDHLIDFAKCPTCHCNETVDHFLPECCKYTHSRPILINLLLSHPDIYSSITITSNNLLEGNTNLSYDSNCNLCAMCYVMEYIKILKGSINVIIYFFFFITICFFYFLTLS